MGRSSGSKDVARVELGAQSYSQFGRLNGRPGTLLGVYQLPGANALDTAKLVRATMQELGERFPEGVEYTVPYDTTIFVTESIKEVVITLFEAIASGICDRLYLSSELAGHVDSPDHHSNFPCRDICLFGWLWVFSQYLNALWISPGHRQCC